MGFTDEEVKKIFVPKRILSAFICEWFAAACLTGLLFNLAINHWIGGAMAAVFLIFNAVKLGIFDGKRASTIAINTGYLLLSILIITGSVEIFLN